VSRCRTLVVGLAALGLALLIAAPAQAAFGDRPLKKGNRGHDVRVLQDFLSEVGLDTTVDGQFGPATARQVRKWKRASEYRRVNARVARHHARKLRGQVEAGITVAAPAPATAPGETATLGSDGLAIAPESAPQEVKDAIAAANRIAGKPYKYGGGHGRWEDSGYDCSGAMSYTLHGAGLLNRALTSGDFARWGESGAGEWITIYAHGGHGYLVIAGLRFDTGWNNAGKGPRWSDEMRPDDGYTVRHPAGL
jgi:cell wall-associated NlpC family hydrolase